MVPVQVQIEACLFGVTERKVWQKLSSSLAKTTFFTCYKLFYRVLIKPVIYTASKKEKKYANHQSNRNYLYITLFQEEYMVYGYIRVSTDKQTVENQRFEIVRFWRRVA